MFRKISVVVTILFFIIGGFTSPSLLGNNANKNYSRVEVWHSNDWPWNGNDDIYIDLENDTLHIKEDIHKAVDMVKDNGIVFIHKTENAKYDVGRNPVDIRKPLILEGEEKEKSIVECYVTSNCVFSLHSDNIIIKNLTIRGALYPSDDDNPIQSGIIIYEYDLLDSSDRDIMIFNNIIKENSNGITIITYNEKPKSINISENEIVDNELNGIIVDSGCGELWNNNICKNKNSGINIWGGEFGNIISENNISLNGYGIWNDQGQNNSIFDNKILNNSIGIAFWNKKKIEYCCGNNVHNNYISFNNESGMIIGYVTQNSIFNNTFEENVECGLNIMTGCDDNTIYHNNFMNNGKHGFIKKKYSNAADNEKGNKWYNVTFEEGNYWSDYLNRTNVEEELTPDDYKGTWYEVRNGKSYFLPYYLKIYNFKIGLNIYVDLLKTSEDKYPWVRRNGWYPQPPENLEILKEIMGKQIEFKAKAIDNNDDNIKFLFMITNESGDVVFGYDWTFIDENDDNGVESGNWSKLKNCGIPEPGSYILHIKAIDVRAGEHNKREGFDRIDSEIKKIDFDIL